MSPSSIAPARAPRKLAVAPKTGRPSEDGPAAIQPVRRHRLYEPAKRTLDIALAAAGLIVSIPLFALISLAIRLESRGPIVFVHERLGKGGRPFRCLKFRSMRADADERLRSDSQLRHKYLENDFKIPLDQDPRVTRVGRFLRKSSLDELPQLLNVLAGSMSLVGPRPI
ncbi:MAG: sugar transferase, partial [Gemmatimonadales bacterium]